MMTPKCFAILSLLPIVFGLPYGENGVGLLESEFEEPIHDDYEDVFIPEAVDNPPVSGVYFVPLQEKDIIDEEIHDEASPDAPVPEWRDPEDVEFFADEAYEIIHPEPLPRDYDLPIDEGDETYELPFTPDVPVTFAHIPHPNALEKTMDLREKEAIPYMARSSAYPITGILAPLSSGVYYESLNPHIPEISRELQPPVHPFGH